MTHPKGLRLAVSEGRTAQDPGGTPSPSTAPGSLGALLAALRLARGWSQLRVAEQLTAAAGLHTVSRHEVSRWERGERVPGDFWLGWLAVVLDVPGGELTVAAEGSRRGPARRTAPAPPPVAGQADLLQLAHAWLADPAGSFGRGARAGGAVPTPRSAGSPDRPARPGGRPLRSGEPAVRRGERRPDPAPPGRAGARDLSHLDLLAAWLAGTPGGAVAAGGRRGDPADAVAATVAALRRQDDLVGGADLAGPAGRELGAALGPPEGAPVSRRLLGLVAEAAQLTGWLAADAGDAEGALTAYRTALAAAAGAGDRPLAAHVLGSASHLLAGQGDPRGALLLARTGLAGARRSAPATLRALLLHRVAFAAALCGERRAAHTALGQAATAAARRDPAHDPSWLYWLDEAELAALTGRCLAALGRPLRAEPLLTAAVRRTGQPRTTALYGAWLARVCLDLGEVERAGEVAGTALLDAVRSGSARAAAEVTGVRSRLAAHRDVPEVRRYAELASACRPYLPEVARSESHRALEIRSD
ncbi:helix-turn-helix domain-containing protein [Phytohabitans kaempferiae]|uniref:Helix-turn-helix domain-containing protein n=1 Tax=Phytohabitans kaempferiae TaxID=1620943 RepID=A0ABV6M583_9ACTN